ncbi:MAG TPA: UvrD-helicase domain-containing protein [Verrucomicrobiota bacterium]|nr:UvrD-helicase domain-containing protein [Verrucomicrobiota bacterium]
MTDLIETLVQADKSFTVEASAGTGKTHALTRRYLSLVATRNPATRKFWAEPSKVVAITFTRAAAAEMRDRINKDLHRELTEDNQEDSVLRRILEECQGEDRKQVLEGLATAPICTIHGLCSDLLNEFPEISGVPPGCKPVDPGEEGVLRARFVGLFVDAGLAEPGSPLHTDLSTLLLDFPLDKLRQELGVIASAIEAPDPDWEDPEKVYEAHRRFFEGQAKAFLKEVWEGVQGFRQPLEACLKDSTKEKVRETLEAAFAALEKCEELNKAPEIDPIETLRFIRKELKGLSHGGIASDTKVELESKAKEALKGIIATASGVARLRGRSLLPSFPDSWPEGALRTHAARLARLARVGGQLRREYAKYLLDLGLLRYDDLETRATAMLEELVAENARPGLLEGRFEHVLVDELQDVNGRQAKLIDLLAQASRAKTTFRVGDPKQSIYRFRGADVAVFMRQASAAKEASELVDMPTTRRTAPELNAFFNELFPKVLTETGLGPEGLRDVPDCAPVPWTPGGIKAHRKAAALPGKPVDLLLRFVGKKEETSGDANAEDDSSESAMDEASRIADYLKVVEKECQGCMSWSNVAVLVPKWAPTEELREALERKGIPAQVGGGRGLLGLPEVRDLVNLVRLWANPDDDLAALGVLRGAAFGLSDLGLWAVARWPNEAGESGPRPWARSLEHILARGTLDAGACARAMIAAGHADQTDESRLIAQLVRDSRALAEGQGALLDLWGRAGKEPTAELLAEAIARFRLEAVWLASPRVERAVANAWRFVETVRAFEARGPDLVGLCDWLDSGADVAPEGLLEDGLDAVTITTIHGAKGREWKLVVLAMLGKKLGGRGEASWTAKPIVMPDGKGSLEAPRVEVSARGFLKGEDKLSELAKHLEEAEKAAEAKRLLYVAMTRARDRLAISGELGKHTGWIDDGNRNFSADQCAGETKKALEGSPPPLFLCDELLEFIVAGMELKRPDAAGPVLVPERWAGWVRLVDDALLKTAAGDARTKDGEWEEACLDEEAAAWRSVAQIQKVSPSQVREVKEALGSGVRLEAAVTDLDLGEEELETVEVDARALGDAFHAAVAELDFTSPPPDEAWCAEVAGRFFRDRVQERAIFLREAVGRLFESELGKELRKAADRGRLFTEVPVDAIVQGKNGPVRVQGRMDLLFEDAQGKWCVVDHKVTDACGTAEEIAKTVRNYAPQLEAYRAVLEAWKPGQVGSLGLWLAKLGRSMWLAT